MTLGEKILELRQINKMTQKQLADLLNVSDKVISRWENGKSLPDVIMMQDIAKVFNVQIIDLYENVENNRSNNVQQKQIIGYIKSNYVAIFLLALSNILTISMFLIDNETITIYSREVSKIISIIFMTISFGLDIAAILLKLLKKLNLKYLIDKNMDIEYRKIIKKQI